MTLLKKIIKYVYALLKKPKKLKKKFLTKSDSKWSNLW